jgi:diacylglycerol kinase (ATP)
MWILMTTEDSIKAQLFFALLATILGFYFDISATEWANQVIVIGLVLVAEAANTAIEEVADFIHPEFHKKIGLIKDIAAGAPSFAAIISLIVAGIIYVPKILLLF